MNHKANHGLFTSCVIGFLLSSLLTFATYYLVDRQTITGTTLFITILGFGLLQMLIQIIFFLHLGRGPKPFYNIVFFGATFGAIVVVVGGSVVIINNLHSNMLPSDQVKKIIDDENIYQIGGEKTGACNGQYANHQVSIKNDQVSPKFTVAKKCDTLTFKNEDSINRKITFGIHPEHLSYAGQDEVSVRKGLSKTITLSEPGAYKFHDHLQAEIAGDFTVTP